MAQECSEKVLSRDGGWNPGRHGCTRTGKVFDQDKWWCIQHSPAEKAKRMRKMAELDEARRERMSQHMVKERYDRAAGDYCRAKGLTVEQLFVEVVDA